MLCGLLPPNIHGIRSLLFENVEGVSDVLFRRSLSPNCHPHAINSVDLCLDNHDIAPRRQPRLVNLIQLIEWFQGVSSRLRYNPEHTQGEWGFRHESQIIGVLDKSNKQLIKVDTLTTESDRFPEIRRSIWLALRMWFWNPSTPYDRRTNHTFRDRNRRPRDRCQLRYSITFPRRSRVRSNLLVGMPTHLSLLASSLDMLEWCPKPWWGYFGLAPKAQSNSSWPIPTATTWLVRNSTRGSELTLWRLIHKESTNALMSSRYRSLRSSGHDKATPAQAASTWTQNDG